MNLCARQCWKGAGGDPAEAGRAAVEAREVHISLRTLQRRLQEGGLSFQEVLEQARHQLARHYLHNSALELNEAAYLLGYEDSNSFVRAFRGWEGVPPGQWRGAQRAKAVLAGGDSET